MKSATITEAKNGLSSLLDRVRAGESILITDRGRPVARLEPVTAMEETDGRLLRLERAGSLRIGEAAPPIDLLRSPAPRLPDGASAVDALMAERRDGR
jgi:prevent-host-death family protein